MTTLALPGVPGLALPRLWMPPREKRVNFRLPRLNDISRFIGPVGGVKPVVPTLRQGFTLNTPSGASAIPIGATTNAGDCLVVWDPFAGGSFGVASGAGATWVELFNTDGAIWVGWNCSAGNTTFTYNGATVGTGGLFTGVKHLSSPVIAGAGANSSATSPSQSYSIGNLLIGVGSYQDVDATLTSGAWSSGLTDHAGSYITNHASFQSILTWAIATTGSSTTHTESAPGGASTFISGIAALLNGS